MLVRTYLKVKEMMLGDFMSFSDQAYIRQSVYPMSHVAQGYNEVAHVNYDSGYWIVYTDGSMAGPFVSYPMSYYVYRPVPAGLLDWSDRAFANAPVVSYQLQGDDTVKCKEIVSGVYQAIGNEKYYPVTVTGYFGDPIFTNWPGIGPSPAKYKMKAFVDNSGVLYHSDGNRDFGQFRKPVKASTDWALPYIKSIK